MSSREDEGERQVRVLSRAGKARSKKWGRSYNVEDEETAERYWISFDDWKIEEEVREEESEEETMVQGWCCRGWRKREREGF